MHLNIANETRKLLFIEINFHVYRSEILLRLKTILNIVTILKHKTFQDNNYIIVITALIKLLH